MPSHDVRALFTRPLSEAAFAELAGTTPRTTPGGASGSGVMGFGRSAGSSHTADRSGMPLRLEAAGQRVSLRF